MPVRGEFNSHVGLLHKFPHFYQNRIQQDQQGYIWIYQRYACL